MSRRQLVAVVVTAIAARLSYLLFVVGDYTPRSDAKQYLTIATRLSEGHGVADTYQLPFVHPTAFRPPLYPVVLGGLRVLTPGAGVLAGQLVNLVLGTVVVVLAAVLATRIAGPRAGLAAGVATALYPPLVANDTVLLAETLAVALLLAVVLLLLDGRTGAAGLVSGLLVLTKPSAQAFLVVIAVWLVIRLDWRSAARFVLVAIAVVAPWVVRNWLLIGTPTVVTSNGFNLAAKYSPEAQDPPDYFVDSTLDRRFEELRFARLNEAELDRALADYAIESVRDDPAVVPKVLARNTLDILELPPWRNDGAERDDGRNLGFRKVAIPLFYVVTASGVAGLVVFRRRRGAELLSITGLYFTAVSVATVAPPRVRAPVDVALCIGAGLLATRLGVRRPPNEQRGEEPNRAPGRALVASVTAATVAVALVGGAVIARTLVHGRAERHVREALDRDGDTVTLLARRYPLGTDTRLPELDLTTLRRDTQRLEHELWLRYPQLPSRSGDQAHAAARLLHEANFLAGVLTFAAAAEEAEGRQEGRDPSLPDVRDRYETVLEPSDPRLPPWGEFISGADARRAAQRVDNLRRTLAT